MFASWVPDFMSEAWFILLMIVLLLGLGGVYYVVRQKKTDD